MAKYRPLTVISWVFLFGGMMAFPVGAPQAAAIEWSTFSTQDWLSVGFVVLFTTFLVYLLNIYALGKVQPTVVAFTSISSLCSWAAWFGWPRSWGVRITWRTWGGCRRVARWSLPLGCGS